MNLLQEALGIYVDRIDYTEPQKRKKFKQIRNARTHKHEAEPNPSNKKPTCTAFVYSR